MPFAVNFGVKCLCGAPWMNEEEHRLFFVETDVDKAICPDCNRVLWLNLFQSANNTMSDGIECAERVGISAPSVTFAYYVGDEDRCPTEFIQLKVLDQHLIDVSITEMYLKWNDYRVVMRDRQNALHQQNVWEDIFSHPSRLLCGESSPEQAWLAPLLAGAKIWNAAVGLARNENWLVWPVFADIE